MIRTRCRSRARPATMPRTRACVQDQRAGAAARAPVHGQAVTAGSSARSSATQEPVVRSNSAAVYRSMRSWKSDFHQPIKLNPGHHASWETLVSEKKPWCYACETVERPACTLDAASRCKTRYSRTGVTRGRRGCPCRCARGFFGPMVHVDHGAKKAPGTTARAPATAPSNSCPRIASLAPGCGIQGASRTFHRLARVAPRFLFRNQCFP